MDDSEFEKLVLDGIGEIPEIFRDKLNNVAFIIEDQPSPEQRKLMNLNKHSTLLGLYQGVPQSARGNYYYMALPDKITIFKNPLLATSPDPEIIKKQVANTVWHEIGHHFGLNHEQIAKSMARRNLE